MKLGRSQPLARRTPLRARTSLRARPKPPEPRRADLAEQAWKQPRWCRCQNCGLLDDRPVHGHHVIPRQILAREGISQWDERNRMDLCGLCHFNHEFGQANRKIKRNRLPAPAVLFAAEHGLAHELERRYAA